MSERRNDNDDSEDAKQISRVRAVAYYRHSVKDRHRQEPLVSLQEKQVRQYADEHGVEIIKEFVDHGKPGLTAEDREVSEPDGELGENKT